ncbi:MAG TPA: hypothetical protein VHR55_00785 [Candidatus Limnocylindria bacterium]|nr:hypothetical protein [Candidatus Limnocylindria bacterium]
MTTESAERGFARLVQVPSVRTALLVAGYVAAAAGFAIAALSFMDGLRRDGGWAYDFNAYYLAGQRYLAGEPLYTAVEINDPGAYRYLPTFAALVAPFTVLPESMLTWLYRAACLLCVRYLVGSWKAVGWALLFPPLLIELWSLNLTLPLAAGARWALRGAGAAALAAQSFVKYGSALLIGYLWIATPAARRPIILGTVAASVAVAAHVSLDPESWGAFVAAMLQQGASTNDAPYIGDQLLFLVPSTLGDFLLRLAIAGVLMTIATRQRWGWLAFAALVVAVPTMWLARLAALVGVPRLYLEDRSGLRTRRLG